MSTTVRSQPIARTIFGIERFSELGTLVPGVALSIVLMAMGLWIANVAGLAILRLAGIDPAGKTSPVSGVLIAILLGIIVRNTFGMADVFAAGARFTVSKILRLGIICVGIKLSILDVLKLGAMGIPVVMVSISTGLLFITWFGRRMRLPPKLATLIAAGTSICGVTAIVSMAPAIDAEDREVAYAVANIAVFGMLGMLIYPYLARLLLTTSEQIGMFLGTAVHDTSQVVGAAMAYKEVFRDEKVLQAATVTKLTRNLFLAVVVPLLSYRNMLESHQEGDVRRKVNIGKLLPLFVLGFVGMALLRSLGDASLSQGRAFGLFTSGDWKNLTDQIGDVWGSRYMLGSAMAAVGLGTSFSVFKGMGARPFVVGFIGAIVVGSVGFAMSLLLGGFVKM